MGNQIRKKKLVVSRKRRKGSSVRNKKGVNQTFDQGYNSGFNQGYNQGYDKGSQETLGRMEELKSTWYNEAYDKGYDTGHNEGYDKGHHEGGDGIVDRHLPAHEILPGVSAEEIIAAGIQHLNSRILKLMSTSELGERIVTCLDSRTPLSVVRLGDGELLTLAQESVMPIEQIRKEGKFLDYAGVHVPDLEARDLLKESIMRADIIGIPKLRLRNYQPLAFAAFQAHQIDYRNLTLTDSLVNYYLYEEGYLSRILPGRRVLVIGNKGPALAQILQSNGIQIAGVISPVQGIRDASRIMEEVSPYSFDLALVSSGISAVIIAQRIASELGKVALDFGHLADSMIKGEAPYR